jgi:hypothetical protein
MISLEVDFEDLPLLDEELPLRMTGEGETRLRTPNILSVVVTDGEFRIGTLLITVINYADIATTEDWPLVWVVGNGKLGQVEVEFFTHVQ